MTVFTNPIDAAAKEAADYIRAVLDLLADRDPLNVLAATPEEIAQRVTDLSDEDLRRPEAPGKWSVIEIVQHLADSELVWSYRLRCVIAEADAPLTGYDQDRWAQALRYLDASLQQALEQFWVLRSINLRLLDCLTAEQLQHAGVHSERGEETVEHMVKLYAGHDLVHLAQLDRVLSLLD